MITPIDSDLEVCALVHAHRPLSAADHFLISHAQLSQQLSDSFSIVSSTSALLDHVDRLINSIAEFSPVDSGTKI